MRILRYVTGLLLVLLLLFADSYFGQTMFVRWFYLLTASCFFAVIRLAAGKTDPDRLLSFDAGSIALTGFCVILSVYSGKDIYMDIAIAWALQSYVVTLFLAKYLGMESIDD